MINFGRKEQLELLPDWLSKRIEVNRYETLRLMEQAQEQIPSGALVLDAGSGEGQYKSYFAHTCYTGIDLAVGDETWNYRGLDVLGDLQRLPFNDNTFDAAVCIQTLEHVNEPMRVTNEIGRVLKPGGLTLISDFHPAMFFSGGQRSFTDAGGASYAVEHYPHQVDDYRQAAQASELQMIAVEEAAVPGAPNAAPAVIVFGLRKTT
jgi:ubiquinone/menaquinone biosynthesis C-methylase UbiE